MRVPPFSETAKRLQLLTRLNAVSGISISEDRIDERPSVSFAVLAIADRVAQFLTAFDWAIEEIKKDTPKA
jgi:hypothetical protein